MTIREYVSISDTVKKDSPFPPSLIILALSFGSVILSVAS